MGRGVAGFPVVRKKALILSLTAVTNALPSKATAARKAISPEARYTALYVTAAAGGTSRKASSPTVHSGTKL